MRSGCAEANGELPKPMEPSFEKLLVRLKSKSVREKDKLDVLALERLKSEKTHSS